MTDDEFTLLSSAFFLDNSDECEETDMYGDAVCCRISACSVSATLATSLTCASCAAWRINTSNSLPISLGRIWL